MKCVYVICSSCKICIEETTTITLHKRRKRNNVTKNAITKNCEDAHSQNHKVFNLKVHCDDQYFTEARLSDNLKKEEMYHKNVQNASASYATTKHVKLYC